MINSKNKAKLMLIGCGPHATRIYLKALRHFRHVDLELVLDLESQEDYVRNANKENTRTELWFIKPFSDNMPAELSQRLSSFVQQKAISGVIIATEPLVHKIYAEWALENGLNILIDKPITARADATSKLSSAEGLLDDYLTLLEKYKSLQLIKETIFTVNSQRRFHAGFQFVKNLIRDVAQKTNCPVTFIQAYHCDGQWRLPNEIVTQQYHPYCFGYGKASHSGHHIFDTVYEFYKAAEIADKAADSMEIVSSFIQPNGFFTQLTEADYLTLFGEPYNSVKHWSDDELREMCRDFGEIDLSAVITLKKCEAAIANFSVNLIHNGFAGRTWIQPGNDLYKGNGRIKHESYHIQQGPFQNIQIHAYQAYDKHDENNGLEEHLGGKNHFDVYVFQNPIVAGSQRQPSVYKLSDIVKESELSPNSTITMEQAKYAVVEEFIDYIRGCRNKSSIHSQLEDHVIPVQMISGIYRSHILKRKNANNVVTSDFGFVESYL